MVWVKYKASTSDYLGTNLILFLPNLPYGDRGSTVVKALCYKSERRWLDSRWSHWNFSLT